MSAASAPAGAAAGTPPPSAVTARGLELRAGGRTVFSGVDVEAPVGSTVVVRGGAGTGKTSLLLTLAGRMRPSAGQLRVLGEDLPARAGTVRREVALAEVRGVNELDDALTVEQHVAERLVLHQPWHRPWVTKGQVEEQVARVQRALAATGADVPALRPREFVSDIDPLERMALGVVLALIGRPRVLVVDDVDALRRGEDRRRAWESLAALQRTSTRPLTVVASCTETTDVRWHPGDDRVLLDLQGTP